MLFAPERGRLAFPHTPSIMRRQLLASTIALSMSAACTAPKPATPPASPRGALTGLVAQHVVVTPTYTLQLSPELGWEGSLPRHADVLRQLDDDIAAALDERGVKSGWVLPDALAKTYKSNPTYAADPYRLAEQPLLSPALKIGDRLPEPLASQVRTMVALNDGRYVLAPVELRLEREAGGTGGRGLLRLVLLDARASDVKWIGRVQGDVASSFGPALTASVAERFADLVTTP
jgi:hypothetical protein